MMKVAIMGYGTIGSGVAEILERNKEKIGRAAGEPVELKYVLDLNEFPGTPVEDKIIHDFSILEQDSEVSVVVETMGGLNPSYPYVKACLLAGKHVATSNKALVAAHGTELLQIARERQVNFLFEASVGGGIPIVRTLYRALAGEEIVEIAGILNGTTNFILTKMEKEGATFGDVLRQAQDLGYAERNPEADVEGHDTCRKIAILTAMATGRDVDYEDIFTEGITHITDVDFRYAQAMGTSVKLLGSSRMDSTCVRAWVAPVMIGENHPLYSVNDVFNGILVEGNTLGTTMYYGSGAGKLPTASAVVADIVEALQNRSRNVPLGWVEGKAEVVDRKDIPHRFFVRIEGGFDEREAEVEAAFGRVETVILPDMDEFAIVTQAMAEGEFLKAREGFESKAGPGAVRQMIRVDVNL